MKMKGQKSIYHANGSEKKARIAVFISGKTDFKTDCTKRQRRTLIIKRTIQQEDTTIVNIYAANMGAPKYIKQLITNIKEVINSNTIVVGDFNTPLTSMDHPNRKSIKKQLL